MKLRFLLFAALMLVPSGGAFAFEVKGTDHCFGSRGRSPYNENSKPDTFEHAIEKFGKAKLYTLLALAEKIWSPCPIIKSDPANAWSEARWMATLLFDTVLPIKVVSAGASEDCDSGISETFIYGCSLLLTLGVENKTDDITFNYIATSCLGQLQTSPTMGQMLTIVHSEPVKRSAELGPHQTKYFRVWYNIGFLQTRFTNATIEKDGVLWCHVLAAKSNVGNYRFTEDDAKSMNQEDTKPVERTKPTDDAQPTFPSGQYELSKETNEFLKSLGK